MYTFLAQSPRGWTLDDSAERITEGAYAPSAAPVARVKIYAYPAMLYLGLVAL